MDVEGDRDRCIGAGLCALTAPAVFAQDDDGIVVVLSRNPEGDARDEALQAESFCPSGAVRISRSK